MCTPLFAFHRRRVSRAFPLRYLTSKGSQVWYGYVKTVLSQAGSSAEMFEKLRTCLGGGAPGKILLAQPKRRIGKNTGDSVHGQEKLVVAIYLIDKKNNADLEAIRLVPRRIFLHRDLHGRKHRSWRALYTWVYYHIILTQIDQVLCIPDFFHSPRIFFIFLYIYTYYRKPIYDPCGAEKRIIIPKWCTS